MAARWMRAQGFFTALRLPGSPQAAELTCAAVRAGALVRGRARSRSSLN
jgi:hypothetical protein